jgi:hypothetical protein
MLHLMIVGTSMMRIPGYGRPGAIVLLIALTGCGDSGKSMAPVHGRVTLDGQPLPYASVVFQAERMPPSGGYTDKDGNYELIHKRGVKGAALGMNQVTIVQDIQRTGGTQRVPARYNQESELTRDVVRGDNEFNFDLTTDGKKL